MIHPSRSELEAFSDKELVDVLAAPIAAHLATCEFCTEYVSSYESFRRGLDEISNSPLSATTERFLQSLDFQIRPGTIIALSVLPPVWSVRESHLAADGRKEAHRDIISLATLYSENPEVVMKLMRDQREGSSFVQLIAESPELTANVLVCSTDHGIEIVTNDDGRAVLSDSLLTDPMSMHWQIRLPEVSFDLQPLIYDPEKPEYAGATILETDRGDRIRVTLIGKTVGKQIEIELLALDGQSDFSSAKIAFIADDRSELKDAGTGQRVLFSLPEKTASITLRIFH